MSEFLTQSSHGQVLEISLNRPDKKNALTLDMYQGLTDALRQAETDKQVRVVLLSSSSDSFCAGNDIADFIASLERMDAVEVPQTFLQTLAGYSKPVIAAVPGAAVGIGTTLLLHCDLVLASEQASFQLPFARLGLVPEGGASLLLPQLVGHRKAFEMVVLGESFDARCGAEAGLVNRVFAHEELRSGALSMATELAALAPEAVRQSKQMLKQRSQELLQQVLVEEIQQFAQRLKSEEAQEAFTAFMEKRQPDFSRF